MTTTPYTTFLPKDRDGALQMLKELLYDRQVSVGRTCAEADMALEYSVASRCADESEFLHKLLDLIERS